MFLDARVAETPDRMVTDVAIVGSGAAGLALAARLLTAGVETLVLESGGEKFDQAGQEFYRAASIAPDNHGPVHLFRRRAYGGTTAIWGGRCIPFDPIDFEDRPWLPHASWPISYQTVADYYPDALAMCDAGEPEFAADAALGEGAGPLVNGLEDPDVVLDRIERFSKPTHLGRKYRALMASHPKARLLLNAAAVEVLTSPGGGVARGLRVRTAEGRELTVEARRVVLAAGALETPRLLLASNRQRACGLGNEQDLVGRFYQGHLEGEVGEIRFLRPRSQVRISYEQSHDGVYCRRYIWLSPEAQRREKLGGLILRPHHPKIVDPMHGDPVLSAMYLVKDLIVPEYARSLTSTERAARAEFRGGRAGFYAAHVRNVVLGSPKLGLFAVDWLRRRNLAQRKLPSVVLTNAASTYALDVNAEQTPNRDSRIGITGECDAYGLPRLAIDWRTRAQDREMIVRSIELIKASFESRGVAEVRLPDEGLAEKVEQCTRVGGHHIGTARMAAAPSDGVVDADCAVFGTANLYVAGAATFPTSGFANPTLTLIALALRLGDHLAG